MEKFQYKPDILVQIFHHASPWDLIQLNATCRSFNSVLQANQNIWRLARKRLTPPVPDPTLPPNLFGFSRSWSESSYVKYIFGNTTCTSCGDVIDEPFPSGSFALRLFPCGKRKQCNLEKEAHMLSDFQLKGFTVEHMQFCQSYIPHLEFTGHIFSPSFDSRHYTASQFKIAEAEWQVARELFHGVKQPQGTSDERDMDKTTLHISIQRSWLDAYMKTAEVLVLWQKRYRRLVSKIVNRNIAAAKLFANDDRMDYFLMAEGSSTFNSYILSLNREQTIITLPEWRRISEDIYHDMQDDKHGIMQFHRRKPVVCPLCPTVRRPRLFDGSSLLDHAMRRHRGVDRKTLLKDAWK